MYSGGHLELSKRPDKTFVSHFIPLRCYILGRGRHQVWVERGGKSFMSSCIWLSIIIVELKLWYIMLLILVYWRKLCYSMFNPFYVILLHIFMWYCSSWEMVEPMSINSHVMKQSGGHWLVCSNYRGVSYWIIVIPEPRFFLFVFVLWSRFLLSVLRDFPQWNFFMFLHWGALRTLLAWEKWNKKKNLVFNILHSLFEQLKTVPLVAPWQGY